jgi:hypothetical protein
MVYKLKNDFDKKNFITKVKVLIEQQKEVELNVINQKKSVSTNSYFHLIVGWFALEYGETREHVKQEMIKKEICPETFVFDYTNRKTGELSKRYRSFATLNQEESNYVIDKFRNYSSKVAGIYLPDKSDLINLHQIDIELKKNKQYL